MSEFAIIPLNKNKWSIVDQSHHSYLSQWNWHTRITKKGIYARRCVRVGGKCKSIHLHREIAKIELGRELLRCEQIDHINHNPLDNRWCNLRVCSKTENIRNQEKRINTSSRFKGVTFHKRDRVWQSSIKTDKGTIFLGCYKKEEDAALAYNEAAVLHHGCFAHINIIHPTSN